MASWLCATCGAAFPPAPKPPAGCRVCEDFRQYVGHGGQRWVTLEEVAGGHAPDVRAVEPGLTGVGLTPAFAIGQRALLAWTPAGNILWDCVPLTPGLAQAVRAIGGVAAIAASHPHFYSMVAEWSREFGAAAWLPTADAEWRPRTDFDIVDWEGRAEPLPGTLLVQVGGHFAGSAVLHWTNAEDGGGALLTGDSIYVASDRRWVSFMRSYPNLVPLPARDVLRVAELVAPLAFRRLYSGWWERTVEGDADASVQRSAERYLRAISEGA